MHNTKKQATRSGQTRTPIGALKIADANEHYNDKQLQSYADCRNSLTLRWPIK